MSDFPAVSLGDIAVFINGDRSKNYPKGDDYVGGHIPFISATEIENGRLDLRRVSLITQQSYDRLANGKVQNEDILFCLRGTLGKIARVNGLSVGAIASSLTIIRAKPGIDPRFLYYFLSSPAGQSAAKALDNGSAQPNISVRALSAIDAPRPSQTDQEAISAVLGALDDKIDLNRQMSATLERMARALFRSWFVDFDPVHAKARGEAPAHMDAATAALFPDRFGEDGLPEGWREGTLADIAILNPEKWGTRNAPATIEYVDLSNTKWGVIEATTYFDWSEAPSRARMILKKGDTVVGTVRPGNGSYAFIGESGLTGSTGFAVLRPRDMPDGALVYLAVTDPDNIDALAHRADGAAYPAVRPDVVAASPIVVAPTPLRAAFATMAQPLIGRSEAAKRESRTLAALRDALLPKLMSGELRVRDTEQQIAEAV